MPTDDSSIEKVGFFHLGTDGQGDPMHALLEVLRSKSSPSVAGALIVLPEAFNIQGDYNDSKSHVDPSTESRLRSTSREYGAAFVAGLVQDGSAENPGYSCARLIDGDIAKTLSYKAESDGSPNYQPYPGICDTPVLYGGVCVAALICLDAAKGSERARVLREIDEVEARRKAKLKRHRELLDRMAALSNSPPAVLCIPSRMTTLSTEAVVEAWGIEYPDLTVIVANAGFNANSVIHRRRLLVCSGKTESELHIWHWTDLTPVV